MSLTHDGGGGERLNPHRREMGTVIARRSNTIRLPCMITGGPNSHVGRARSQKFVCYWGRKDPMFQNASTAITIRNAHAVADYEVWAIGARSSLETPMSWWGCTSSQFSLQLFVCNSILRLLPAAEGRDNLWLLHRSQAGHIHGGAVVSCFIAKVRPGPIRENLTPTMQHVTRRV